MAAATFAGSVCAGSYWTTALPRARFTCARETPATLRAALSQWATQLAQFIPLTERAASAAGSVVGDEADIGQLYACKEASAGLRWRSAAAWERFPRQ